MTASKPIIAVIPARLGSTRLPEKPIKDIAGKTLIERVLEQGRKSARIDHVIVATDSTRIEDLVLEAGGEVVMTSESISTGSERVAIAAEEYASRIGLAGGIEAWELIANIQGDMPFLPPAVLDKTIDLARDANAAFELTTVVTPIIEQEQFERAAVVKAVVTPDHTALYFSRAPIPHSRDGKRLIGPEGEECFGLRHIGLYVFTPKALAFFQKMPHSALEDVEMLEQLRALESGYRIGAYVSAHSEMSRAMEVDTEDDLERAREFAPEFDKSA